MLVVVNEQPSALTPAAVMGGNTEEPCPVDQAVQPQTLHVATQMAQLSPFSDTDKSCVPPTSPTHLVAAVSPALLLLLLLALVLLPAAEVVLSH
jgi:hypothetical protein